MDGSRIHILLLSVAILTCRCAGSAPMGLHPAAQGPGPRVIFDLDKKPLPEIPFPNDLATRIDPASPTGRRLNISEEAPTRLERNLRRNLNRLEGFGIYQPITVKFDRPLDLQNIIDRHRCNQDFLDDAVYVLNLNPQSPEFGRAALLDFGQGNFPVALAGLNRYYRNDPRSQVENLLFETVSEDLNGDGRLQLSEDTDGDGVLDRPNIFPAGGDPVDDLMTFFEAETNTLIFRPVVPLEQETTYAVVLTKRLIGEAGNPVRSPFPYINHIRQNRDLRHLKGVLRNHGLDYDDVAHVWTFTTQGPTRDLEALRRGLYGNGPFSYLKAEFPPRLNRVLKVQDEGVNNYILPVTTLLENFDFLMDLVLEQFIGNYMTPEDVQYLLETFASIDYFIAGEFKGPYLLNDKDGIATKAYPADNDEVWDMDRVTGKAVYSQGPLIFFCAVPKADRGKGPPFPVAIYNHGYSSLNIEILAYASALGRYGVAMCGISAVGSGPPFNPVDMKLVGDLLKGFKMTGLFEAFAPNRARDLNNDGQLDPGGDFWTSDTFHTRDMLRQTVLDEIVLVRLLRSFDGRRKWPAGLSGMNPAKVAGDFNGDGIVDLGGPGNDYFAQGSSLGGIMTGILTGVEPAITAAIANSGGAGLADIALRSELNTAIDPVFLRMMGPMVAGVPVAGGNEVQLQFIIPDTNVKAELPFALTDSLKEGDLVRIYDTVNGETDQAVAGKGGAFRLHIPADTMDPVEKRALLGLEPAKPGFTPLRLTDTLPFGDSLRIVVFEGADMSKIRTTIDTFGRDVTFQGTVYPKGKPLISLGEGLGVKRNTPEFRRLLIISQMILEPGDPISYAPHYFLRPLKTTDYDAAVPGANMLMIPTSGDTTVPVATGIALARAAGIVELFEIDGRYGKTPNQVLIDNYVVESLTRLKRFDGDPRFTGRGNVSLGEVNLDVDNLSNTDMDGPEGSGDGFKAPRLDPPLRLTVKTPTGVSGLRIPYLNRTGFHVFVIPEVSKAFDINNYMRQQVGYFFGSRGKEIRDEPCMENNSCDWIPALPQGTP